MKQHFLPGITDINLSVILMLLCRVDDWMVRLLYVSTGTSSVTRAFWDGLVRDKEFKRES